MANYFSNLFAETSTNRFNNYALYSKDRMLEVSNIGLHIILNSTMGKDKCLHSHSFLELHFSLSGYAVYKFSDHSTLKLEEGSWLFLPKNYPHKILEYSDRYIKYSCSFSLNRPDDEKPDPLRTQSYLVLCDILNQEAHYHGTISQNVLEYIKNIYEKFSEHHILASIMIANLAENIVYETLYPICTNTSSLPSAKFKNSERIAIAIQFIADNIYRPITVSDVAKKFYLSPRQLNRIFRENLSISVSEFILAQKCDEAIKLLQTTSLSITDISEILGFTSSSYFNTFFKKRTGMSPSNFRKIKQ